MRLRFNLLFFYQNNNPKFKSRFVIQMRNCIFWFHHIFCRHYENPNQKKTIHIFRVAVQKSSAQTTAIVAAIKREEKQRVFFILNEQKFHFFSGVILMKCLWNNLEQKMSRNSENNIHITVNIRLIIEITIALKITWYTDDQWKRFKS